MGMNNISQLEQELKQRIADGGLGRKPIRTSGSCYAFPVVYSTRERTYKLAEAYRSAGDAKKAKALKQLGDLMLKYEDAEDPTEAHRLKRQITELFGLYVNNGWGHYFPHTLQHPLYL
jgi:hypothetical protein